MKKLPAILIIALLFILLSCGGPDNGGPAPQNSGETNPADLSENLNEAIPDPLDTRPKSSLPDEMDFGGRDFRVLTLVPEYIYEEFIIKEETGDPVIDALYKRALRIEEKYNVNFTQTNHASPSDAASRSVRAGDDSYDLIVDGIGGIKNLGIQSSLFDLYRVPYISEDLDKPWWDQALKRDLSIKNKIYFQSGDIVMKDKLRLAVMYFNKDMFKALELDFPYQYVYDGTWTIDKLVEITKNVNADLNGDGVMDQYDQWGFMAEFHTGFNLYTGAGERMISLNADGIPELTINTPRSIEVIQKVLELCTDGVTMFHADTIKGASNVWHQASAYFQENRFLMRASSFEPVVRDLRAMPTDFGLIPIAKYDANQENYYASVDQWHAMMVGIPITADESFSGFIANALAYESGDTLKPAFYDLCLLSKVLRDDESEGMLDIIFDSKVYDIGYVYGIGTLPTLFSDMTSSKQTDFISRYERISGPTENALEKFINSYDAG